MCYWKQWRYTRTKVLNLLKLGTYKKEAIFTALSRKESWHLTRILATQAGRPINGWKTGVDFCQRPVGENTLPGFGPVPINVAIYAWLTPAF